MDNNKTHKLLFIHSFISHFWAFAFCEASWLKLTFSFLFCVWFSTDERDRVQKKTFTKWVNKHLVKVRSPPPTSAPQPKLHSALIDLQHTVSLSLGAKNKTGSSCPYITFRFLFCESNSSFWCHRVTVHGAVWPWTKITPPQMNNRWTKGWKMKMWFWFSFNFFPY